MSTQKSRTMVHPGSFQPGDERAREAGRKGGKVTAEQRRKMAGARYQKSFLEFMTTIGLTGASWLAWRAVGCALFALVSETTDELLAIFRAHTGREAFPTSPIREGYFAMGRRSGKTRFKALVAFFLAIRADVSRLAPGELAVIAVISADRRQARQVMGYLKGIGQHEEFAPFVHRELSERIEFRNGVNIEVHTASYRTTRGYTVIGCLADEISFWRTEDGAANLDTEVIGAIKPGMATIEDALLVCSSSPYGARGELYNAHEHYFGKDVPHILVWNSDTRSMNPTVPTYIIDRAYEMDPVAAASEYGQDGRVQFRRDVELCLDPVAVRAATVENRHEMLPRPDVHYVAFVDPSGGSQDSFTLAIAHQERDMAVLDALRERKPPFSPDDVVGEFCDLLKRYRVSTVTGDRYAGEWPRERFRLRGITYAPSELSKSDIYREAIPQVNGGRVALLDHAILRAQLIGLERRVARGGKDSIDHAPGGRDDVANAAAGALLLAAPRRQRPYQPKVGTFGFFQW